MTQPIAPDPARVGGDLETLSGFRDPHSPGWTRPVFSSFDRRGREWVAGRMEEAGLHVKLDAAANLIGTLPGTGSAPGAIVTGSHTDTVRGGGRFDGIIGVLGAIELVRCLREARVELDHDLVVVDFLGEEPNDYGLSCVGSRAIAGTLEQAHLALMGPDGSTLADAIASGGGEPGALATARWPADLHCYLELHIEQGPTLEQAGIPIGVVTGIVGIHRLLARVVGRPDHAGTTPMGLRRDALAGAAEVVLAVERLGSGAVATTGRLEVRPGALNVVPAEADLWAEARSVDEPWLEGFGRAVTTELDSIASRRQLETSLEWISRTAPVPATPWVVDAIERAAESSGVESILLPSGAGHDASQMARLGPMGMVFVPSRDGRSHCPEEWSDVGDIATGIAVLAKTVIICDHREEAAPGEAVQEAT
jgi:N-carbamoyl-L-amino-acid hydrolase